MGHGGLFFVWVNLSIVNHDTVPHVASWNGRVGLTAQIGCGGPPVHRFTGHRNQAGILMGLPIWGVYAGIHLDGGALEYRTVEVCPYTETMGETK